MLTCTSIREPADLLPTPLNLSRLYRDHISPADWRGTERTAFVEGSSHNCACKKIAAAVAALDHRTPEQVAERIYNCYSAKELIDEGLSDDLELRIYETGWSGGKATHFVEHPLFLTAEPGVLARAWAACRHVRVTHCLEHSNFHAPTTTKELSTVNAEVAQEIQPATDHAELADRRGARATSRGRPHTDRARGRAAPRAVHRGQGEDGRRARRLGEAGAQSADPRWRIVSMRKPASYFKQSAFSPSWRVGSLARARNTPSSAARPWTAPARCSRPASAGSM
jgi:hypothetical protein